MSTNLTKNIGIFGGYGFVGTSLTRHLLNSKIKHKIFTGNAMELNDVEQFYKKYRPQQIIFLIGHFSGTFQELIQINVETLERVLAIGVTYGLKKIIFASTGAVYGESPPNGSTETDELHPNTVYGLTKQMAEMCVNYYKDQFQLQSIILRFPAIYGSNSSQGVIHDFLQEIKTQKTITIHGDGTQIRSFIHVDDVARAIIVTTRLTTSTYFNVASNDVYSINQVGRMLAERFTFRTQYSQPVLSHANRLCINILKFNQELHFKTHMTLPRFIASLPGEI